MAAHLRLIRIFWRPTIPFLNYFGHFCIFSWVEITLSGCFLMLFLVIRLTFKINFYEIGVYNYILFKWEKFGGPLKKLRGPPVVRGPPVEKHWSTFYNKHICFSCFIIKVVYLMDSTSFTSRPILRIEARMCQGSRVQGWLRLMRTGTQSRERRDNAWKCMWLWEMLLALCDISEIPYTEIMLWFEIYRLLSMHY